MERRPRNIVRNCHGAGCGQTSGLIRALYATSRKALLPADWIDYRRFNRQISMQSCWSVISRFAWDAPCDQPLLTAVRDEGDAVMVVKVLGPGCKRCHALAAVAEQALDDLGHTAAVEQVTDYAEIARYGIMSTPALVVDD